MESVRINKYLSEVGFCSRREADVLIAEGRVRINGLLPELGSKVLSGDIVSVDGRPIQSPEEAPIYIMYHKPVGITCTTDLRVDGNIIDAVAHPKRIFPIGRLDKPSEGLILLTDDGDIVNKILRARNHHEKEYIVQVEKPITEKFLRKMRRGVPILDTVTRPCVVEKIEEDVFRIILTQGLNRQIRRMCQYLSYQVCRLQRIRIMNLHLDIPVGTWRNLREQELRDLQYLLRDSQKTYENPPHTEENPLSMHSQEMLSPRKKEKTSPPRNNFTPKRSGKKRPFPREK